METIKKQRMIPKSRALLLGMSCLFLFYCFAGIGYDREWHVPYFFMKLKPYPKLFFQSAIGESDRSILDLPAQYQHEERLFEEYFEGNALPWPFNIIGVVLLQAGIFYLLVAFHLLMQRQSVAVQPLNTRIVLYHWLPGIFMKILLFWAGWSFNMLYDSGAYILLFSLYVLVDIPVFYGVYRHILVYA